MAQDATPQAGQEPTPATEPKEGQEPQDTPTGESKTFSEDYVKTLRDEAARHRVEAQEAKTRVQEFEDATKSESEKLTGKVSTLTDENKGLKGENLRLRVAIDKKLPADLIDRLRGNTPEELAEDADKLLSLVKAEEPPPPEFDGGAREPAPEAKTPEQAHNDLAVALFGAPNQ